MKAMVLVGPKEFEVRDEPIPAIGSEEILVRNLGCGVCEGDTHFYRGEDLDAASCKHGCYLGHESAGIVEKSGSLVSDVRVGDRVTLIGGGFSEYVAIPAGLAVKLPRSLDPRQTLGEPMACAIAAGWRSRIKLGDRVAIVGVGFMGMLMLQLARNLGAARIIVLDLLDWRLTKSVELGADETYNCQNKDLNEIKEELPDMDVVIEASGLQEGIDIGTVLVKEHGTIVIFGYHRGYREVDMKTWNWKSIDVVNGHVRNVRTKVAAMKAGVALLESGRLHTSSLVDEYPLAQINQAFDDTIAKKKGVFKAVICL